MKSLLFLILILASSFWCYENYGQNLPVRTILSHTDGRSMEVVVLSREQTQVTFKRQSDGRRYSCEIGDLSLLSKCKVYWHFKLSEVSEVSDEDSEKPWMPNIEGEDHHIGGMYKTLMDLQEDLRLLDYKYKAAETDSERNTINNHVRVINLKIKNVEWKLAEYLSYLKR